MKLIRKLYTTSNPLKCVSCSIADELYRGAVAVVNRRVWHFRMLLTVVTNWLHEPYAWQHQYLHVENKLKFFATNTCTVARFALVEDSFMLALMGWNDQNLLSSHWGRNPINTSATTFSTQSNYSDKYQACSSFVAPRRCRNLAKRCFREGTGNNVQKHMIHCRLSNVSDCCVHRLYAIDAYSRRQ